MKPIKPVFSNDAPGKFEYIYSRVYISIPEPEAVYLNRFICLSSPDLFIAQSQMRGGEAGTTCDGRRAAPLEHTHPAGSNPAALGTQKRAKENCVY